jgi:GT2 family glycosyltransferase
VKSLPVPCTAVIVTYQSGAHIGALLSALQAERGTGLDLEVLVVDNASTDSTAEIVSRFDWARCVPSGGNIGYAAGVNLGNRLVPAERAVLVLNPDLVIPPGTVAQLLDGLEEPGVGVIVPRMEDTEGALVPSLRYEPSLGRELTDALFGSRAAWLPAGWSGMVWDSRVYRSGQFPDWATGAALLVSSECRAAVGDWDERYFLYSEETDFMRRVRAAGFLIRYEPAALVRHFSGGSGKSDQLYALCTVNTVRYYRRYHPPAQSLAYAAAVALRQVLRTRRPAARLALRALTSRTARGALPGPVWLDSAAPGPARRGPASPSE